MNAPNHLTTDAVGTGLLVTGARPHLSWRLPAGWTHQDGYTMTVSIDGVEHPEIVAASAHHLFVDWPWRSLTSGETVAWRVRTHLGDQRSAWSEHHTFEAGLLARDWSASWVSPHEPDDAAERSNRPAYSLAGAFTARSGVVRARLYATALGLYEVFVNGRRVGDTQLAPGSTSFDRTLYAQAYDLVPYLAEGHNAVEVLVSDGWYRGKAGTWRTPARWGARTGVRLEVHLQDDEGTRTVMGTGAGWTSRRSSITHADLMDGQVTELQRGPGAPSPVLVDAVQAPPVDWSPAPPARVIESLRSRSVTRTQSGAFLVDFGQNASGWVRLTDLGPAGTRTVIDHGEYRGPDGDLDTRHLDSARPGEDPVPFVQRDEVVSSGDPDEVFEPRHTVHGFRYARVSRHDVGVAELDPSAITMQVVHTDLADAGSFECSDPDLNRLHEMARWSFRGNAVDVPTDCPTRERLGWTGDYQIFVSTAVRLFDVDGFSRKWLRSVRDDQLPDGRIVNSSPDPNHLKAHPDPTVDHITGSAGWGDAIVHVPWVLHETYGDRAALRENWDAMVRWVDFALGAAASARHPSRVERSPDPLPHERYLWDGTFHWGEWSEPKTRSDDGTLVSALGSDPRAWFMADKGEVGTAYLHRSLSELANVAGVLGKDDEARRYRDLASKVRAAWQAEFLASDGRVSADTQAAYVRALTFGLAPDALRPAVAQHLVARVHDAGDHLATGFLSTADLLPALADAGHADVAYAVLLQRTYPSWLGMLDRGATTIWEDWDGIDEKGEANASLNHYSKGAVVRFLHTHTLGLRQAPGSVAWESFLVAPVLGGGLTWARGAFDSPQGPITAQWRITDGAFRLDVDVPPGSTATVRLPDDTSVQVGPGRHSARCAVPAPQVPAVS